MRIGLSNTSSAISAIILATSTLMACSSGDSGDAVTGISGELIDTSVNACQQGRAGVGHIQMTLYDGAGAVLAVSPLVMTKEYTRDEGCTFSFEFPAASRDLPVYGFATELVTKPSYMNQSELAASNWVAELQVNGGF